jgi:predicted TIM-barrel fold metal-dependent hydrolase
VKALRQRALDRCEENARRTGRSRRDFLASAAGAATTLLCANDVLAAGGGRFALDSEAALDEDAAQAALGGKDFIFDVQTHHVTPERQWLDANPHFGFLKSLPQGRCGESDPLRCYSRHHYVKDIFMDSDTTLAVLSALPAAPPKTPIAQEEIDETRRVIDLLEGTQRLLIHGQVLPNAGPIAAQLDGMQRLAESQPIKAWKLYTQWGPHGKGFWLDDKQVGIPVLEQARKLGVTVVCVHKGIILPGFDPEYAGCRDIGVVAKAFPDLTFIVYHSGFDPSIAEGPHDPGHAAGVGLDALIRSLRDNGIPPNANVYAELGSTWRILMQDPTAAAHGLGKLLKYVGEDRVLWGTDCIWYGSPQDQIQAFRAFQISAELQERYGYPALTPGLKAKVLGLSAAGPYGVDPARVLKEVRGDSVARVKADPDRPGAEFVSRGPRTRREFLAALRAHVNP